MTEAGIDQRASEPRVSLGVAAIDEMLSGGLMPHRPYLLVGPSGTGKTTLALQFLCEGVRRGERGLYVTLEDPPNEVRWNHRSLRPELERVDVFDAIPDVMRYERAPFKDISATRAVVAFHEVPDAIRQTPEFTSVEVTGTALEQMLRGEVHRRGYARLVIDSLTALQYFCMKGFDPIVGAQTFLRFLTDLRTTTLLTVESPLEDVETPERMLARGEIRLFRWELEGVTVRAIGVEKLRGSSHDARLHPYRIGTRGIDVQLAQTISRDTRQIVEPALAVSLREEVTPAAVPVAVPVTVASEPLSQQIDDLVQLGVDIGPLRSEVEATLEAVRASRPDEVVARLTRISAMAISLAPIVPPSTAGAAQSPRAQAFQRVVARADRIREGRPPTQPPPSEVLLRELETILAFVPARSPPIPVAPAPPVAKPTPPPAAPAPPLAPVVPPPVKAVSVPLPTPPREPTVAKPAAPEAPRPELPARSPAPARPPASPPPVSVAPRPAPRRASHRAPLRVATPEPPPLPTVFALPPTPAAPSPPAAPPSSPPAPEPTPAPETARAAPAPRRRRRTSASKASVGPGTEGAAPPAAPADGSPATPKPRKRTVRRKKAPPVVSATAVGPPEESVPTAPAVPPPPTTQDGSTPSEGA